MDKSLRFMISIGNIFPRLDDMAILFHTQLFAAIIALQPAPKITRLAKVVGECPGCLTKVIGRFQAKGVIDKDLNLVDFDEEDLYG